MDLKDKLDQKLSETIIISSKIFGEMVDLTEKKYVSHLYSEEYLLSMIITEIRNPTFYDYSFLVNSQIIKGEEFARFILPTRGGKSKKYDFRVRMENEYFEVELSQFKKILIE